MILDGLIKSIDLFTKYRMILIRLLMLPSLIILFGSKFKEEEIEKIYVHLPKPNWLYSFIEVAGIILKLFALAGFVVLIVSIAWTILVYLFYKIIIKNSYMTIDDLHWHNSIKYGLGLLLEASMWWFAVYTLQILYKVKSAESFFDLEMDMLVKLPIILYMSLFVVAWLAGKANFEGIKINKGNGS